MNEVFHVLFLLFVTFQKGPPFNLSLILKYPLLSNITIRIIIYNDVYIINHYLVLIFPFLIIKARK